MSTADTPAVSTADTPAVSTADTIAAAVAAAADAIAAATDPEAASTGARGPTGATPPVVAAAEAGLATGAPITPPGAAVTRTVATANPARGETVLTLGDWSLTLRPSFSALVSAEGEVGSLFALVEKAAGGQLTLADTIALIFHCLVDRPAGLTRAQLGELVVEAGIGLVAPVLRVLLGQIVTGL